MNHSGSSSEDMGRRVWPIAVGLGTSSFQLLPPLFLSHGWLDPVSRAKLESKNPHAIFCNIIPNISKWLSYWLPWSALFPAAANAQVGAHRCHHGSSSRTPAANTGAGHGAGCTGANSASGRIYVAWMRHAGYLVLFGVILVQKSVCILMYTDVYLLKPHMHPYLRTYPLICVFIC